MCADGGISQSEFNGRRSGKRGPVHSDLAANLI
jgi:hypothetical protein